MSLKEGIAMHDLLVFCGFIVFVCIILFCAHGYWEHLTDETKYRKCVFLILEEFKRHNPRYADKQEFTRRFLTKYIEEDIEFAFKLLLDAGYLRKVIPEVHIPDPNRFGQEKLEFYQVTSLGLLETISLDRKNFLSWRKNVQAKKRAEYSKEIDLTKVV